MMTKKPMKQKSKARKKKSPRTGQKAGLDIIHLILKDHKPLKALIKTMKSQKATYAQKKAAFEKFAPTLIAHAKPEEQTWYRYIKTEEDHRVEGLEGDVEHGLADQLCEEIKRTSDQDMFMAKVKVLAELVEHHIEEEEDDMLPEFKKDSSAEKRASLGEKYLNIQKAFLAEGGDDAPHEKSAAFNQMEANQC